MTDITHITNQTKQKQQPSQLPCQTRPTKCKRRIIQHGQTSQSFTERTTEKEQWY